MNKPQYSNQLKISSSEISSRTSVIARSKHSRVLALRDRRNSLNFDQHNSIGDQSGEYAGKNTILAPTASITSLTFTFLSTLKLSINTIAPCHNLGPNIYSTYVLNPAESVLPSIVIEAINPSRLKAPITLIFFPLFLEHASTILSSIFLRPSVRFMPKFTPD